MDVFDLLPRIERVDNVVDKLEHFTNEIFYRHLLLLAEIEQHSVEAVPDRTPLVFKDEPPVINAESEIAIGQQIEFCDDRLKEGRNGDRVVNAGRYVANAEFERREKVMRSNVPPDL